MKTFIKKVYFQLAAPLWRRVLVHVESISNRERDARQAADLSIQKLENEVQELKKIVDAQNIYLNQLREAGLHSVLSRHAANGTAEPEIVLSAVSDLLSGMEPSIASSIHGVSAAEIIAWARMLTDKTEQSKSTAAENVEVCANPDSLKPTLADIQLLENQLAFNHKLFVDRERSSILEIARLEKELNLSNGHLTLNRAAAGK